MTEASASIRVITFEALSGPADGRLLSIAVAPHASLWLGDAPEISAEPLPAVAESSHGTVELEVTGAGTLRVLSFSGAAPRVDEQAAQRGTEIAAGQILRLGTTEFGLQSAGEAPQPEVGGITCPKCNALNPTEMRWCRGCGFELLPPGN
jgi:hypothetical protein